ncbi:PREDICTED: U3 small nucleolar RNA-associated protein 14 homolog A [Vollenhovia emeryi]|uniref:U3 small nucleolar RNA-associated protein 14 homolog A n=1 Tax=Vollenhovia emeryi TaxID=411798 RepID=UPI0005F3DB97|nr:PREDICTED: U3 small nucleolar RNA-associated protein 14 homolog A [Vollenhovia emeryi]
MTSDTEEDENLRGIDVEVSEHHSKLVKAVAQHDKTQRVKKAERSEPSLEVSEYHLAKSGATDEDAVRVRDLIESLERTGDQSNTVKRLRYIQQKNKVLSKPLEKPAAERIKRTIGYDKVKDELKRWESVVAKNRTAEQLSFPLKRLTAVKDTRASNIPEFLRGFNTKSDLMKKIDQVDPTPLLPADKEGEKDNLYKMTLEEVIMRRKEAARLRAQQSYKEAKAHRQSKIKSKKFHRIQRKSKIKQQLKDFEQLKDSNPQEALAKLEQLDRTRAEERMSLRHKNTGQWAKNKQIRAKYDKETRQVLAEQLAISKELTQKVRRTDSDEEDEEDEEDENMQGREDMEDDTLSNNKEGNVKTESEIDDFIKLCRNYYDKKQQTGKEEVGRDEVSDEIVPEKENETLRHDEKNSALQANRSDTENSVLRSDKKGGNLQASASDTESLSCSNKKNSSSLTDTNNVKSKTRKRNKKKKSSPSDPVDAAGEHNNKRLKSQDISVEVESSDSKGSKKKKSKQNVKGQNVKKKRKTNNLERHEEEDEDYLPNLEFENPKRKPILDSPLEETTSRENAQKGSDLASSRAITNGTIQEPASIGHEAEIDPRKYVNIKPKYLKTQLPDVTTGGDEDSEQEEESHRIMSEAFADDDVVEEFRKEEEEEMKQSQPQEIDQSLPGWGSWGGSNIKKNKRTRKKSRFILTVPKVAPRKPENQGKVIVFEHDNEKLRKHLVKELPYPFTRVKDFEASIRAPISRTFVPMNAHLRLVQPAVTTKLGQVIEPMDENELVKKQPMLKKPLKRVAAKANKKKNTFKNNNKKKRKRNVPNV